MMPSIYDLKPAFQNILRPICHWLAKQGVTPNQVTLAALIMSLLMGGVLALFSNQNEVLLLLPLVLFLRMALNAIDGMLAREHQMTSSMGAVLNEIGDVISDVALYLPLALFVDWPAELLVVIVILAVISELSGIVAVQIGASRRYDGPMGKSDRAFVFGTLGLILGLGVSLGNGLYILLIVVLLLLVLTIWRRLSGALREVSV